MTRTTNARLAGFTFLLYIAAGIPSMIVFARSSGGEGVAARLASIAQHPTGMGVVVLLSLVQCFSALVLAVTLYSITREQDRDLAMLAMLCRVAEGVLDGAAIPRTLGLMALATAGGADAPDPGAARTLGAFLFMGNAALTATFFAVGSTIFAWLLLRGRMIPAVLAWIGVFASVVLVVGLPLQLAGFLSGPITGYMWIPMAAFEIPLAVWLLIKGVAAPTPR